MRLEALRIIKQDARAIVREEYSDGTHFDEGPYAIVVEHGALIILETLSSYWRITREKSGAFHGSELVPKERAGSEFFK